jgi:ribosomal-protein-alanine N-acetyltransferase
MAIRFETPILQTDRLTLRPIVAEDVPTIQREFGRWSIIKNMTTQCPWPYPEDGAKHWFEQSVCKNYRDKTGAMWAITKRGEQDVLIGIIDVREDVGSGNRGFWLAESEWDQGYMTEASEAVNDWVFTHTQLTEMIVYNVASNIASRRVKEKNGSEYLHTVIQDYHCGESGSEVWRIGKDAWLNRRKKGG